MSIEIGSHECSCQKTRNLTTSIHRPIGGNDCPYFLFVFFEFYWSPSTSTQHTELIFISKLHTMHTGETKRNDLSNYA